MRMAYYPGCSLQSSSTAYDVSVRAVAERLGLQLFEIDDWNCCGASEAATLDQLSSIALVARNLALADPELEQMVAPCAACFLNLKKTDKVMGCHPEIGAKVNRALAAGGLAYQPGTFKIRHLVDVIHNDVGEEKLRSLVTRPLIGLRVASYYGCMVVRPHDDSPDDPEQPQHLDDIMRWLGAEVVDFPLKAHCCGGHLTQISEDQSHELIRRLLKNADEYHSDVISCLCPMCQLNLDAYQGRVNNRFNTRYELPVLFFTQLIGVALGMPMEALGFGSEIVEATTPLLERLAKGAETTKARRRPRKAPHALPMPTRGQNG